MTTHTGQTIVAATRAQLGPFADRITSWRTERYLEAGFYSPNIVETILTNGLAVESNRPDDYEIAAIGGDRAILATLSLRRPDGAEGWRTVHEHRPRYGLEDVHGTAFVSSLPAVALDRCWEAGRFLRDRSADCSDAVVAVTTAAAELLAQLAAGGTAEFLVGEVEPTVALRHLNTFGLPIITGDALASPKVPGLLEDRYQRSTVVPFAVNLTAITEIHRAAWKALGARRHLLSEPDRVG